MCPLLTLQGRSFYRNHIRFKYGQRRHFRLALRARLLGIYTPRAAQLQKDSTPSREVLPNAYCQINLRYVSRHLTPFLGSPERERKRTWAGELVRVIFPRTFLNRVH